MYPNSEDQWLELILAHVLCVSMSVNVSKLRRNHDVTSDVEIQSLVSEGSDHASCMVTVDAALQSTDLAAPRQDCHWQVTNSGKIDFLELYGGSSRMSHKAALTGLRVGQPCEVVWIENGHKPGQDFSGSSGTRSQQLLLSLLTSLNG